MTPTDTTSLTGGTTGIAAGLDRAATKGNLAKAGQQFESVFTGMMMKAMRQAKLADPLFDSQAIDTFRDMQDQKFVQSMAEHTPLGIGKAMIDFLARGLSASDTESASAASTPDLNGSQSSR